MQHSAYCPSVATQWYWTKGQQSRKLGTGDILQFRSDRWLEVIANNDSPTRRTSEDDDDGLELLQPVFRSCGAHTVAARNVATALAYLDNARFDEPRRECVRRRPRR